MIKLDKLGNPVSVNGFDGKVLRPETRAMNNVFFGELSKSDERALRKEKEILKKKERERHIAEVSNQLRLKLRENQEYLRAKAREQGNQQFMYANQLLRDKLMAPALAQPFKPSATEWTGNPLSGFGEAHEEERIDPDSQMNYEIAAGEIREAEGYGLRSWLQARTSEYSPESDAEKVSDYINSNSPYKRVMQTMPDYVTGEFNTMISMPGVKRNQNEREYYSRVKNYVNPWQSESLNKQIDDTEQRISSRDGEEVFTTLEDAKASLSRAVNQASKSTGISPQAVKLGGLALLAFLLLR